MMSGFIKYIDKNQGNGYILGYDDVSYYFEFSSLDFAIDLLKEGLEVRFQSKINGLITYAIDISLLV